jgi:uridine phosphorylase
MNHQPLPPGNLPHLTPARLVGPRFGRKPFGGVRAALVGFCPRPRCLDKYQPRHTTDQYFIHVPPASVQICSGRGEEFLSITHVYGGPVSSALIEELAYYGITHVQAYGLAGGLGTKPLKMGDYYLVERALALDGTTPHYTTEKVIAADEFLSFKIKELAGRTGFPGLTPVQAMTADAIYREYDEDLSAAKANGCDIVNCDSSHLYAVSRDVGLHSIECGVISDVAPGSGADWQSTLAVMLSADGQAAQDPLTLAGKIVEFYVEVLLSELG